METNYLKAFYSLDENRHLLKPAKYGANYKCTVNKVMYQITIDSSDLRHSAYLQSQVYST